MYLVNTGSIQASKIFDSDNEAAEQTEKDGIKIIHDMEFDDENSAAYVDTPENRELLKDLAL